MINNNMTAAELMPKNADDLVLLHERAEKLAQSLDLKQPQHKSHIYMQFKLNDNTLFGIEQNMLDEVLYVKRVTTLTWLPTFIYGVINWKGQVLTVLDANYLCHQQVSTINEMSKIIVVTYEKKSIGLLVNELCNFYHYEDSELKTNLQSPIAFNKNYFLGLIDSSVILLNMKVVLTDPKLKIEYQ
ncbi:MAG: hypothetical protein GQ569_14100 [Methylococcaceae bacterium]|nr:hypothetical protein [Methylococcaceae bacterium]